MQILNILVCYLSIFLNALVLVKSYSLANCEKMEFHKKNIIIFIFISIFNILLNYFVYSKYKIILNFLSILVLFKLNFKDNLLNSVYKTIVIYCFLLVCDFLVSIILMFLPYSQNDYLTALNIIRVLPTILVSILMYTLFKLKIVRNYIIKIFELINKKSNTLLFVVIFFVFLTFLIATCLHAYRFIFQSFIAIFIILFSYIFLCYVIIKEYIKNKNALEEQKSLLNIMNEYEIMLEKDRINRHEMLNNLLILHSFKNKSSKKYDDLLNSIINEYQTKKYNSYTSLYNLPNGIKGIVYYKMANIVDKDIKFHSIISKDVYKFFDSMDEKQYYKICKILGILIDNAIEAAMLTEEKSIFIEIYKNKTLNILIENSCKDDINFELLNQKGFSTNGENRGYGLYIVDKILNSTDNIKLEQYTIKEHFISTLIISL